jgi:hypothetical protein
MSNTRIAGQPGDAPAEHELCDGEGAPDDDIDQELLMSQVCS